VFLFALFLAFLEVSCESRPYPGNYTTLSIDPVSLKVTLTGRIPGFRNPDGEYYSAEPINEGRYSILHFVGANGVPATDLGFFFVTADDRLSYRQKYQDLLHGPFDTVYAITTYYYAPMYDKNATSFETRPYFASIHYESPEVLLALPDSPDLAVSAVSLVRVFPQAGNRFLIASANYSPDGHLVEIHVNGAQDGHWIHSNLVIPPDAAFQVATMIGDEPKTRKYFGLPLALPATDYLRTRNPHLEPAQLSSTLDVVNVHYNRNHWVRQDAFLPGKELSTRFLAFRVLPEDLALHDLDARRPFGESPKQK
jgi:hypothetical protein